MTTLQIRSGYKANTWPHGIFHIYEIGITQRDKKRPKLRFPGCIAINDIFCTFLGNVEQAAIDPVGQSTVGGLVEHRIIKARIYYLIVEITLTFTKYGPPCEC